MRAARPNVVIKIPGTREGVPAIEEAIFAGVPVNVTLLFSHEQYLAAAEAYLRGIERRIEAGLNPNVPSVASVFINFGARPQRLLWASTGVKDPTASDILYVEALAVPFTVNTMPEKTLKAFADHGKIDTTLTTDGSAAEVTLRQFADRGIDIDVLATQLQDDGAKSFVKSWKDLIDVISSKCIELKKAS